VQNTRKNTALKIIKNLLPWALFLVLIFLTLKTVYAQSYLGDQWDKYLSGVEGFTPSTKTGEELATGFVLGLVRIVRNVLGGVALIMGILYGLRLVLARGQEERIAKQKANFLWVFIGFVVLIISENIAGIFNPEKATSAALIDFNAARDQLRDVADYIKWFLGSIIVLLMTISSIRMVTAGGDEEVISTQKRNITWSGIGILTILLASNIVNAIYFFRAPDEAVAAAPEVAITEIGGVIKLILVFIGPIAIAFTIYAGFMYLTSLDNEERMNRAKRMIIGGITGIVIIYAAFAIVNSITSSDLSLISTVIA